MVAAPVNFEVKNLAQDQKSVENHCLALITNLVHLRDDTNVISYQNITYKSTFVMSYLIIGRNVSIVLSTVTLFRRHRNLQKKSFIGIVIALKQYRGIGTQNFSFKINDLLCDKTKNSHKF